MVFLEKFAIILGYMGSVFLSLRFIPQIYKSYKLRQNRQIHDPNINENDIESNDNIINRNNAYGGISILFLIFEVLTCLCFGFYSIYFKIIPMLIANLISFFGCILVFILVCKK